LVFEDKVQLPRLYLAWHTAGRGTREDAVGDVLASILSSGKNSRLYRSLVLQQQIAQSANAFIDGAEIAGTAAIEVTAKPGKGLTEMEAATNAVLTDVTTNGVTASEIQAAVNGKEAQVVNRISTMFGIANGLATYHTLSGNASLFNKELDRFKDITPAEVQALARKIFGGHKVVLSIVPEGKPTLAAEPTTLQRKENPK
jgi:zinc protease